TSIAATTKAAAGFLPSFFSKKKPTQEAQAKDAQEDERVFQENLAQLNQRTGQVMNGLTVIGLEATTLGDEALVELFYNFYNPQTIERKNITLPTGEQAA
ncbi:MAG TPA: hypothetical protein VHZ04_03745, partial [Candidatus Paceibacterota bacterium]|nr:hypothetical protein [Candidatus Paceibacterota bacterium]